MRDSSPKVCRPPNQPPRPNLWLWFLGLTLATLPNLASGQVPFSGETEPGVPFPLPLSVDSNGRLVTLNGPAALAVSWDGKLLMYMRDSRESGDSLWDDRPTGTDKNGYVFATFDKGAITENAGRPDFTACFGAPLPRFADISQTTNPVTFPGNDYPEIPGVYENKPYPYVTPDTGSKVGSMGELGLLQAQRLANLMYPVPEDELPTAAHGANPYPSDATGTPSDGGPFSAYRMVVSLQDQPRFWLQGLSGFAWRNFTTNGTDYEPGNYPNGVQLTLTNVSIERNGAARLLVVVDHGAGTIENVTVLEKWKPFRVDFSGNTSDVTVGYSVPSPDTMWLDCFEPTMTLDGRLLVGKGHSTLLRDGTGGTRLIVFYNDTPFGETGWQGPWHLHQLYLLRNRMVAGRRLADRYPIARQPARDYDGSILGDANGNGILTATEARNIPFEGGYPWLSHDGRFVIYTVKSGGVGRHHPQTTIRDGGGTNNRAQVSLFGSVTGWQMWRLDHAAVNPSRHFLTAFDQQSRTVRQRTASFGFGPGFWNLLSDVPEIPLHENGRVTINLVNSNRLLYYEIDLEPYQQRDYGFYLPMTLMLDLTEGAPAGDIERTIDLTRTPDLSGNGHFAHVPAIGGGKLPCEEFDLPAKINGSVPGLYQAADNAPDIHPSWTAADTVTDGSGKHWAPLADWIEGIDTDRDGLPDTPPHDGRGNPRDMDSDVCWGRVGQAMFFRDETEIYVGNDGSSPELNPGTTVSGATDQLTASLWVHPLQDRSSPTRLFHHNVRIELREGSSSGGQQQGQIAVGVEDTNGTVHWLLSGDSAAPVQDWTHVAAAWVDLPSVNESELRLYLNGAEVPNSPKVLSFDRLKTNLGSIRIGCLDSCSSSTAIPVLLLDEVALKNSAVTRSEAELMALLDLPEPSYDNTGLPPAPDPFVNADHATVPTTNPYDDDVARLGADLFHDVRLSANQSTSCGSCHVPALAFTDSLTTSIGFDGTVLKRNSPSLYNQRFLKGGHFWDARAKTLEDQALQPILDPDEMGLDWPTLETYLETDPDYSSRFDQILGTGPDIEPSDVENALATYMRSITAGDSAVDQFVAGTGTLTDSERRGRELFLGKARCIGCHNGPNFTDDRLWTTGAFRSDSHDDGAFNPDTSAETAGKARFLGSFKTPSLRELARTGPYFHDGNAATLAEVIEFYDEGGVRGDGLGYALLDPVNHSTNPVYHVKGEEINRPLDLTPQQKLDLEAFLLALSGTDLNDGAIGFNQSPTAAISTKNVGMGGAFSVAILVDVTDPDGVADLDPTNMPWTLELEVGSARYDGSDGTISPIPGGYRFQREFGVLPAQSIIRARAADWHGLWSDWDEL